MKKTLILSIALALSWALTASAATYESNFGFRIDLPAGWTIVSKEGVKETPDVVKAVFDAADQNKTLADMPENLYLKLKEKIVGGEVEYYYKTDSSNISISVYEHDANVPQTPDRAQEMCKSLPGELSKVSKNPAAALYDCRYMTIGANPGLYIVADAYERGQKYVQYMIQKKPGIILLFTATSVKGQNFETLKKDFEGIMKSYQPL